MRIENGEESSRSVDVPRHSLCLAGEMAIHFPPMGSSYDSLEAELHDAFWDAEDSPEFDWLNALLKQQPGLSLEVGCGSGRLLLPLLKKGHTIEGLEPSPAMLELCRQSATKQHLSPVLHEGSMASLDTPKRYQSILIPAFTLQLSEDPATDLTVLHKHLATDGILYLTTFIPYAEIDGELPENEWYPDHQLKLDDHRVATLESRHRIDLEAQILHREHHYQLTGPDEDREHHSKQSVRWFTAFQLHKLLTDHGFEPERGFGDFDEDEPISEDSQILTVLARKT